MSEKILLINPNSDQEMTATIKAAAEGYLQGRIGLAVTTNLQAPRFIETYEDIAQAYPGLLQEVETAADGTGAIVIACHYDPGLDALKAAANCPVLGIGEASLRMAALLGHRFALLTTDRHSLPLHEELIRKYGLWPLCASVRAPQDAELSLPDETKFRRLAQRACVQDQAEVLVLGCAGLAGLDRILQQEQKVPVLDGIACALSLAEGFIRYGSVTV